MSVQQHHVVHDRPGAADLRRAWWSLALYPLSLVGAFVGEGLLALVGGGDDPATWQVGVAAVPALLVFLVPAMLAAALGGRAVRAGEPSGRVPALVGLVLGGLFVLQNLVAWILG